MAEARPARRHRLVLLLPFVWQLALAPVANGVTWRPLGLPFQMVWQMAGVLVASAAIAWVFGRDEAAGIDADDAA
ncbi:DUF3311 domain-containing protein [Sphingomonas nostoxanthinifaciens]|uniref:DUF3311 domain-containing protein n=1 Tax=Sphingomonas nostoxanthinifaciens TaxID=2872652 RepID=UPI001CC20C22|nr:DUF3311 domain-containing protein [Sphingomonas nostoxanthinifaciens]UAK22915.1 DUF3311 domain-containing protein [Sphingomonas nostoxanthinifaciens]